MIIQDLDPKHYLTCKLSSETAEELRLWVVQDWSPSIPDLSPIVNVWGLLKKNV